MLTRHRWYAIAAVGALIIGGSLAGYVIAGSAAAGSRRPPASVSEYVEGLPVPPGSGQAAALADGKVTLAEYEAAVERTLACGAAQGLVAERVPGRGLRPSEPRFSAPDPAGQPNTDTVRSLNAVVDGCLKENLVQIQAAWMVQGLTTPGALNMALERLTTCMRDAGAPGTAETITLAGINANLARFAAEDRTQADTAWRSAYLPCRIQVEEEQGFRFP